MRLFWWLLGVAYMMMSKGHTQTPRIYGGFLADYAIANTPSSTGQFYNTHQFKATYFVATEDLLQMPPFLDLNIFNNNNALISSTRTGGIIQNGVLTPQPNSSVEASQPYIYTSVCGQNISLTKITYTFSTLDFYNLSYNEIGGYYAETIPIGQRINVTNLTQANPPVVLRLEIGPADLVEYRASHTHTPVANPLALGNFEVCNGQNIDFPSPIFKLGTPPSPNLTLKYSFATPRSNTPLTYRSGFSAQNFTSNTAAPLSIDPNTGRITGRAQQPGTYVYVIRAEAYQGNTKYSAIEYEFVLSVIDCRPNEKPSITISKVGQPQVLISSTVCEDSTLQLNLKGFSRGGSLQWLRNGNPLAGKTDSVLVVAAGQGGRYSCTVTLANACPPSISSDTISIVVMPKPSINIGLSTASGRICEGQRLTLTANSNAASPVYQWFKNGSLIPNASASYFETGETGTYAVRVTGMTNCSNLSSPQAVTIIAAPTARITAPSNFVCEGNTLTLSAPLAPNHTYEWRRNNQPYVGVNQSSIAAGDEGNYTVKVSSPEGCFAESSVFILKKAALPSVNISSTANELCEGATLTLTASGNQLKTFVWTRNNQPISGATQNRISVRESGSYRVTVTDTNQCQTISSPFQVTQIPSIIVQLDSIPPFCGVSQPAVLLSASPTGGTFMGKGVVNNTFDPAKAGLGSHEITYTIASSLACQSGKATRTVVINAPPNVTLVNTRSISQGEALKLDGDIGSNVKYEWTPPLYIDDSQSAHPTVNPPKTTTYTLKVTDDKGCTAQDSIKIYVLSRIYIPDVFTPNGDGHNDVWEINGLEDYPEAEVKVFDRWGNLVFLSNKTSVRSFDGTYLGPPLPEGNYVYLIQSPQNKHEYRGKLLILR
jgi:gliding motility-associated-like protein